MYILPNRIYNEIAIIATKKYREDVENIKNVIM